MAEVTPHVEAATDLAVRMVETCSDLFVGQERLVIGEAALRMAASLLVSLSGPTEAGAALREASRWLAEMAAEETGELASAKVAGHG